MRFLFSLIFCLTLLHPSYGQIEESEAPPKANTPTVGLGVGTIGFFGDLNDRNYGSPFGGNIAYNFYVIQPLSNSFNVKFNLTLAEIRAEERSLERNVNFQSDIRSGALFLEYNFDHFLPEKRKITPFITAGIEAIEFNAKTDLEGYGGAKYYYWKDGTIRNLSEESIISENSVIMNRDYSYETDIREAGFNGNKNYNERAIGVPVGIGVTMHLNDQFDFRFESIMHFTFSDYIDGIDPNTSSDYVGNKKGNSKNDHFLFNGISLSYNFQKVTPAEKLNRVDLNEDGSVNYLTSGFTEDYDNDGVIDLIDLCGNTPPDVQVDSLGCPVDTDGDGVPDYKDEELNTEYPEFANDKGIELTDDMIYSSYLKYIDSTAAFAEVIERDFRAKSKSKAVYKIKLGEYNLGETPEEMGKYLSLTDLNKIDEANKTIYAAGNFQSINSANKRLDELKSQGFENIEIIKRNKQGNFISLNAPSGNPIANTTIPNPSATSATNQPEVNSNSPEVSSPSKEMNSEVVFRVQLGAFKKQPTAANYKAIPNLLVLESGGYYRYLSGSFSNFNEAAAHKVKMTVNGFKGAFVVAYKNGTKVSLKSVGVNSISSDPIIGK